MSRILRRPMFRGGRVDSRGTGITSGLSYKQGGRVGYADAGVVTGGGLMANNIFSGTPRTKDYLEKQQFYQKYKPKTLADITADYNKMMQQKEDDLLMTMGIDDYSGFQDKVAEDLSYYRDPQGGMMKYFQEAKAKDDAARADATKYDVDIEEVINNQIKKPNPNNLNIKLDNEPANPEIDKDTIKKYKDMFREAYGSGRGDDVVSMLMNFAGKALKPEATVKSAFGEFFEEEGKRPSKRKQYDEAAATAAINAYIAGEKSMADTKKALVIYDKKLSKATSAENSKSIVTRMNEDKGTQRSDLKKLIGNTAEFMEDNNIPGVPQQIKKEQAEDPALLSEENIGAVFIDTDSKKVFIIVADVNGNPVKEELYSG